MAGNNRNLAGNASAMVATQTLKRKNTVIFSIDSMENSRRENYVEVARAVNLQFGQDNIACLQPTGRSSYLLTFKNEHSVRSAKEKNLLFNNRVIEINAVEEPLTVIWISGAPYEMDEIPIRSVLSRYGEIKSIAFVKNAVDIGGYCNGDRKVEFIMKEAVPNFLKIGRFTLTFRYRGLERVCRKCGEAGHFVINCPNVVNCTNCGRAGHLEEQCFKCRICKSGLHRSEECPQLKERNANFTEGQGEDEDPDYDKFYSPLQTVKNQYNPKDVANEVQSNQSASSTQAECEGGVLSQDGNVGNAYCGQSSFVSQAGETESLQPANSEEKLSYATAARNGFSSTSKNPLNLRPHGRLHRLEYSSEEDQDDTIMDIIPFGKSKVTKRTPPNQNKAMQGGNCEESTDTHPEDKTKRKELATSSPENEIRDKGNNAGKNKRVTRQSQDQKRQKTNSNAGV